MACVRSLVELHKEIPEAFYVKHTAALTAPLIFKANTRVKRRRLVSPTEMSHVNV